MADDKIKFAGSDTLSALITKIKTTLKSYLTLESEVPFYKVPTYDDTTGFVSGYRKADDATLPTGITQSPNYKSLVLDTHEGERFDVKLSGGSAPRAYAFYDDNRNIVKKANQNANVTGLIETPENATHVQFCSNISLKDYHVTCLDRKVTSTETVQNLFNAIQLDPITEEDVENIVDSKVPTKVSELENDSAYITIDSIPSKTSELENDSGFITEEDIPTQEKYLFVIKESDFTLEKDDTKGVAPYSTSYGYTNITITNENVKWVDGASYQFMLDTKVATSTYRNVRVRLGESGDWIPLILATGTILPGQTWFIKGVLGRFVYKTTQYDGELVLADYNTDTTYTLNYYLAPYVCTAGTGTYPTSRYGILMQTEDGWEKLTNTSKTYSTATTKTKNTKGFKLDSDIMYFAYTTTHTAGATISATYSRLMTSSVDMRYSTNCGTPTAPLGTKMYIVGSISDEDGLFYLADKWWSLELPTEKDDLAYIYVGDITAANTYTFSLNSTHPVYVHNGTEIETYSDLLSLKNAGGKIPENISAFNNDVGYITDEALEPIEEKIKDIELFKFPNVTIYGSPTINNGQISNFSASNYLAFPFIVDFQNRAFTLDFEITTGSEVTQQHNIFDSVFGLAFAVRSGKFVVAISTNGTSWNIGEGVGTHTVTTNTTYRVRMNWDLATFKVSYSTDGGDTYIDDISKALTAQPYPKQILIGITSDKSTFFNGIINLNQATLTISNKVVWTGMDDVGLATRADVSLSNLDAQGVKVINDLVDSKALLTSGTYGTSRSGNGYLNATTKTYAQYQSGGDAMFVGKGTLENVFEGKGFTTPVTEDTVSGWGFLKTETDPTVPSHVKGISEEDITYWNNKSDFSGNYEDLINKPTPLYIDTVEETAEVKLYATAVTYQNNITVKDKLDSLNADVLEAKKSASDGKTLLATAITEKGVETSPTDTYATMASNILDIKSGGFSFGYVNLPEGTWEFKTGSKIISANNGRYIAITASVSGSAWYSYQTSYVSGATGTRTGTVEMNGRSVLSYTGGSTYYSYGSYYMMSYGGNGESSYVFIPLVYNMDLTQVLTNFSGTATSWLELVD